MMNDKIFVEELEYLRWFYQHTDFGPAHEDVVSIMKERYVKLTGNKIPEGYDDDESLY